MILYLLLLHTSNQIPRNVNVGTIAIKSHLGAAQHFLSPQFRDWASPSVATLHVEPPSAMQRMAAGPHSLPMFGVIMAHPLEGSIELWIEAYLAFTS
jgi:hypothetical protein